MTIRTRLFASRASTTAWVADDGTTLNGMAEYLDQICDGVPVGLSVGGMDDAITDDGTEAVKTFEGLDEFATASGDQLGPTEWLVVDQTRIDQFAEATEDRQWIHVDPARAVDGPFGGTIAHGLLTLSLLPYFMHELYDVQNVKMAVNYGFNKVRFISPVPVGAKLRASALIADVARLDGGLQATLVTTVEIDGSVKPAAVIESIVRYVA